MRALLGVIGGLLMAGVLSGGGVAGGEEGGGSFPFLIPFEGLVEGTAPADLARLEVPAGARGFVQVRGDRFLAGEDGRPMRFWGTNLCFGGCFPPHDVAQRMARRLASLGINCVRFHHMDASGYPRGIWENKGWGDFKHTTLHPEALDRLDYLVAQLKKHGIYTNLNLHVSREYGAADGFPGAGKGESIPTFGKGMDHFFPRAVEEQKRYARMLLSHVNSYTGNAYADEPGVAMIEISNEDGLLRTWSAGQLDSLPKAYVDELERQWNEWLLRQYGSTETLRAVWSEGEVMPGDDDVLGVPGVERALGTHGGARARIEEARTPDGTPARIVTVEKPSPTTWHIQHIWAPVRVEKGTVYRLRMRLRANRPDTVDVNCMMHHEPWGNLGLNRSVPVGPEWRDHEFYFAATQSDGPDSDGRGGARITLSGLSRDGLQVAFADVSLRRASVRGLPPGEGLNEDRVAWCRRSDLAARTAPVRRDVVRFLRDTEVAYWQGMRDYLRDELGVKMPVTGTAVGFTSPYIAAETGDFVDSHAYWRHPQFPGRPWDPDNWIVRSDIMVNDPAGSTIATLAARRVFGLPYTVTEYNHPSPHHYEAEGFPLISTYGSFQGWDGLFSFAYCHNTQWEKDHFDSFFDIKANPVKLAVMPACSALFRSGAVRAPAGVASAGLSPERRLELLGTRGPVAVNAYADGLDGLAWQRSLMGVVAEGAPLPRPESEHEVTWEAGDDGRGMVSYRGSSSAGMIGFCAGRALAAGDLSITAGDTSLDGFSVIMVSSLDGRNLGSDGRYLVTAVTRCHNRDMGWNQQGNSVGRNWGSGPTLCEGVPLTLTVYHAARDVKVFPLNPDGTRRSEIGGRAEERGVVSFPLGPRHTTLWYEVAIGR